MDTFLSKVGNLVQPWLSSIVEPKTTPEFEVKPSFDAQMGFKGERQERGEKIVS